MEEDSKVKLHQLKVDGGMVVNDFLMQFQADILGIPVIRPKITETTSLGAAYAAGLATGIWHSTEELSSKWAADKSWQPTMNLENKEKLYAGWRKAVQRSCGWA
jgi:glycerol kinase